MAESDASARAPSLILGTAGHIDHGKSSLIRALTGVDPDRLPEEKSRGITIELGFAPLDLGEGLRMGVVDVPGHEGLVRTMVAGATGIDLVLLVVAADEGVMPQTREHLAICELLGLRHGVVALTKVDLTEDDVAGLAEEEVREALAATGLADASLVRVSSTTGEGVDRLREALVAAAEGSAARTPRAGPFRLWVDRLFAARGFGAVVTGTLIGTPLRVGDAVEILPRGLTARVRGLQSFGDDEDEIAPGTRCAVNLQGVELSQLGRGDVLCAPGRLHPTRTLDVELDWLPEADSLGSAPTSIEFLAGTFERRGRVAPIAAESIAGGARGFARIHLEGEPVALLPEDRFILRGFALTAGGGATLGGGRVLDVAPPHRRRSDPVLARELALLAAGDPEHCIAARVGRAGFAGQTRTALERETGMSGATLAEALETATAAGHIAAVAGELFMGVEPLGKLEERLLNALAAYHEREPLRPGMPRGALRGALPENQAAGAFEHLLGRLAADGRIAVEEKLVRTADFVARLTQSQELVAASVRADAMIAGLEPPTLREWADQLELATDALKDILAHLERDGSLIRAPGDLWFDRGAVDELRELVVVHLREHKQLDTSTYKNLIGTTRKYAVPLMELFDDEHITARRGEVRVLRPGGREAGSE